VKPICTSSSLVRGVEEWHFQLPALLGQEGLHPLPAHSDRQRQHGFRLRSRRDAQHPGDATRDADAAAFAALMRHIKEVDGATHTVVMMQVENEVGVLRDSRDRSPLANRAFAGPVPAELMNYLESHKDSLIPEFRAVWPKMDTGNPARGNRSLARQAADASIPIQTTSPPMSAFEHEVSWRELRWPSDEIFMAWNYARFVEAVAKAARSCL